MKAILNKIIDVSQKLVDGSNSISSRLDSFIFSQKEKNDLNTSLDNILESLDESSFTFRGTIITISYSDFNIVVSNDNKSVSFSALPDSFRYYQIVVIDQQNTHQDEYGNEIPIEYKIEFIVPEIPQSVEYVFDGFEITGDYKTISYDSVRQIRTLQIQSSMVIHLRYKSAPQPDPGPIPA